MARGGWGVSAPDLVRLLHGTILLVAPDHLSRAVTVCRWMADAARLLVSSGYGRWASQCSP